MTALGSHHDRSRFGCGSQAPDRYLREQVTQDIRRRVAACFVMLDGDVVAGYYTLSAGSIALADLPDDVARRLPRYPRVPAIRMGRPAVDLKYRGEGYGAALLVNALQRAGSSEIPAMALAVDAKDDQATSFHRHFAFMQLANDPLALFLPLATAK